MYDPTDGCPDCGTLGSDHADDCEHLARQARAAVDDDIDTVRRTHEFDMPTAQYQPEVLAVARAAERLADEVDRLRTLGASVVADEDMPAFLRMLLLLKVQFDSGEIGRVPGSTNGNAADLLYRMCERFGVR